VPEAFGFDPDTRRFHLTFRPDAPSPATTEVYLAAARHYPAGFDVRLSPGWSRTYDEDRELLHVAPASADVATDTVVELEVVPREP